MKLKLFLFILVVLVFLPINLVSAETDELGYEYTPKKANEIDFSEGDFYVVPLSEGLTNEDTVYAVYDNSEVVKYEQSLPTLFASMPTKFSQYYSKSKWITRKGMVSLS